MANNNEDLRKIHQLENELKEVKKELDQLKAGGGAVGNDQLVKQLAQLEMKDQLGTKNSELQKKNEKLEEKEMGETKDQLNEIKNRQIDQIAAEYARRLPQANSDGRIHLKNGHQYTPEMDIFLRHGAAHCDTFYILRGTINHFVGYPANFFDDLILHCYETKIPAKAVPNLGIQLPLENPAPWPAAFVQPLAGEMNVKELKVNNGEEWVLYIMRNKHNPGIRFELLIMFEGGAKCYQQMTCFIMDRVAVQSGEA